MPEIISREANDKAKGPRLQRLRAIILMLETLERTPDAYFYSAVEDLEDVSLHHADDAASSEYYEENKNYDPRSSFTCNSQQVKNTLVSFVDIFITKWRMSKNLTFGFYSTASIGKESLTNALKANSITLPDKPILELLRAKNFEYENLIQAVRAILESEYVAQYSGPKNPGNIEILRQWSDLELTQFLGCIEWFFGQSDEMELKDKALRAINSSRLFNYQLDGKEEVILSLGLELLDSKQSLREYSDRFVHKSEIELVFLKAAAFLPEGLADPAWKMWGEVENPTDFRSLSEKILAVCPSYSQVKLGQYARKVGLSRHEATIAERSFAALRYRILSACECQISDFQPGSPGHILVMPSMIDAALDALVRCCREVIGDLKSDYHYRLSNNEAIEATVLELFDSCFLSFDHLGAFDE
jgi:hypothetical protein